MNLVSGREMRLIVAEGVLRAGDWAARWRRSISCALKSASPLDSDEHCRNVDRARAGTGNRALARGAASWRSLQIEDRGVPGQFDDMTGRPLLPDRPQRR